MTYPAKTAKTAHKRVSLMRHTQDLLHADLRNMREIARDAQIPYDWLRSFSCDRLPNPSVNRVQALYEFLTRKPLKV